MIPRGKQSIDDEDIATVKTGTLADMTVFSFHPVKHITTGEGGMITSFAHITHSISGS